MQKPSMTIHQTSAGKGRDMQTNRPRLRRVAGDTKPVPVDASGCIVKWLFIGIGLVALTVVCVISIPVGLALLGPTIEAQFNQTVFEIQTSGTASPVAGVPRTDIGDWLLITDTDAIDDSKTASIILDADYAVTGWVGSSVPTLIVRCRDKKLEVYINTGTVVEVPDNNQVSTRIRFDKNEAEKEIMGPSSDDTALFFKSPLSFLNEAVNHETMAFEFTPYNSAPDDTEFAIRGLYDAMKPVLDACGIDY